MSFKKFLIPAASVFLVAYAYSAYGWPGLAMAVGGLMMWLLLHFTRMMHILKRAADRPIGSVASAVMLNAKLRPGVTLMHVVAMTRSLGVLQTPKNTQPEVYRWSDASESHVSCEFSQGKLVKWQLVRPKPPEDVAALTVSSTVDSSAP